MAAEEEPARATLNELHALARSMPGSTIAPGGATVYQVSRKSFLFFRNPFPDAFDPQTLERYDDVVFFWVADEAAKAELLEDDSLPFFTTPHFDGHPSVLLRGSRVGELDVDQLAEVVYDAWLARAPKRAAKQWLAERGLDD
ncbi:MAG: MmcQ/YjbR family DNA-binding protein [Nocardioides sp.]